MRKNPMVNGAKAHGVSASGNPNPKANMPANNVGMHSVKLGSHKSSFAGKDAATKSASGRAGVVDGVGAHLNSQNYVNTGNKVQMGHTKHGVGTVPAYLRNPKNPS